VGLPREIFYHKWYCYKVFKTTGGHLSSTPCTSGECGVPLWGSWWADQQTSEWCCEWIPRTFSWGGCQLLSLSRCMFPLQLVCPVTDISSSRNITQKGLDTYYGTAYTICNQQWFTTSKLVLHQIVKLEHVNNTLSTPLYHFVAVKKCTWPGPF